MRYVVALSVDVPMTVRVAASSEEDAREIVFRWAHAQFVPELRGVREGPVISVHSFRPEVEIMDARRE